MRNFNNVLSGVFFTCDDCGREFSFSQSFLTVPKGQKFRPFGCNEIIIAEKDLCRFCAGQDKKLPETFCPV